MSNFSIPSIQTDHAHRQLLLFALFCSTLPCTLGSVHTALFDPTEAKKNAE